MKKHVRDSEDWESYNITTLEPYHIESFEEGLKAYLLPYQHLHHSTEQEFPHVNLIRRQLFDKVRRLEADQHHNQQPIWKKPHPWPFTEHIWNYKQYKDIKLLHIAFYTSTKYPLTYSHFFNMR